MGVFAAVPWYFCHELHPALHTAGTQGDVDAGELEHDFLQGVGQFDQLRGHIEQAPDEVHIGSAVAIGQKAIVSDSDKAMGQGVQ